MMQDSYPGKREAVFLGVSITGDLRFDAEEKMVAGRVDHDRFGIVVVIDIPLQEQSCATNQDELQQSQVGNEKPDAHGFSESDGRRNAVRDCLGHDDDRLPFGLHRTRSLNESSASYAAATCLRCGDSDV